MKKLRDLGLKIDGGEVNVEYDENGNEVHHKGSNDYERWSVKEWNLEFKNGKHYFNILTYAPG